MTDSPAERPTHTPTPTQSTPTNITEPNRTELPTRDATHTTHDARDTHGAWYLKNHGYVGVMLEASPSFLSLLDDAIARAIEDSSRLSDAGRAARLVQMEVLRNVRNLLDRGEFPLVQARNVVRLCTSILAFEPKRPKEGEASSHPNLPRGDTRGSSFGI